MKLTSISKERSVSVVIPVRNRENDIEFSITSALNQSAGVREIIVVNDGSTDGTKCSLDRISREVSIVKAIHLPVSAGAANARNVGVDHASSEWIAFLDSDDAWCSDKLERQFEAVDASRDTIGVFTGIRYVPHAGRKLSPAYDYVPRTPINLKFLRRLNYLSSTSTALVRREAFLSAGGFDHQLPSCQDWDLWLRLAEIGDLHLIRTPLTICSYANNDRISRNSHAVFEGHNTVFSRIYQADPRPLVVRLNKAYHQARLAQIWFNDLNNPSRAVRQATSSILKYPTPLGLEILSKAIIGLLKNNR